MKNYIFTAVLLFLTISLSAQPIPKYKDASQPIEVRVQDLLSRMTIEEKVAQLRHIHEGSILNDDHTLNLEKMKNIIGTLGWPVFLIVLMSLSEFVAFYPRRSHRPCHDTRIPGKGYEPE